MTWMTIPLGSVHHPIRLAAVCFILCCGTGPSASGNSAFGGQDDETEVFFETEIRPLLAENCVGCHGSKKQSGGLRLDSRSAILKGGDSGPAIVERQPAASLLIQAVRHEGDVQMPPEQKLTDSQIAALTRWVQLGAAWPASSKPIASKDASDSHWAFQPVTHPDVPRADASAVKTPVDAFVLAKLDAAGLSMSAPASRRALIRRVTYSLTGLPPTADEVAQFETTSDPRAYERLVERLLESPAYGEHWARHWLDVARYSDTKGYVYAREERFWIHAWNYRDWVVQALNTDMSYDRFLLLQLAADQVPDRNADDLAAMGFLTIGRRFLGVKREIIDDRIDVVCRGTMSLTVGCARCHDHKYDPIPTADYYSLYGVFNSCRERIVPISDATGETEFTKELATKQEALEKLRQDQRQATSARVRERLIDYLRAQQHLDQYPEEGFDQILAVNDLLPSFVHRWRDHLRDADRRGDPVFAAWHTFARIPEAEFAARTAEVTRQLSARNAAQLHPRVAAAFGTPPVSFDDVITRYAGIFADVDRLWKEATAKSVTENTLLPVGLPDDADEQLRRLLYGPGSLCEVPDEPIVHIELDVDSGTCTQLWKLQGDVDRTIINSAAQPKFAVILEDRQHPNEPRIFKRGNPANKGEDVPRQFLSLLSGTDRKPFAHGSGRLELARAIIDPANPLTARVIVNRVWAHHFGAGLVSSVGDFGTRADPPSHPELLDWLTSRFIADGWSLKKLHRLIVLSAAFRQSSSGPEEASQLSHAQTIDPANRLLWRMNAHRLSFEELRDSMLAVSGGLETRAGGKPTELFKPPFPTRRTLYGLVDRQFLPGTLRMFDFANPDLHIPQRSETTVPQQSLFLMNHPLVLERVRELAASITRTADESSAGATLIRTESAGTNQIRELFRRVLQREPTPDQLSQALQLTGVDDGSESEPPPPTAKDWSYGVGALDETKGRVTDFTALPHFTGTAWQGGAAFPDAKLGWVQLTAAGGHPGNDRQHAAVRRWTAPEAMTIAVRSEVIHEPAAGDGIRAFIVSSRAGVLQSGKVHQQTTALNVESLAVDAGETIDFVVDIGDVLNSDQHFWRSTITPLSASGKSDADWNSESDFPRHRTAPLSPFEQLAQVLLCSNEFMFVD